MYITTFLVLIHGMCLADNGGYNALLKTYQMIDDNGNIIKEFSSGQSVVRYFNVKDLHHQLIDAVNNNTKYNGYYWKVKKEFPINVLKEGA